MPATRSSSRLQAKVVSPPTEEAKPKKAILKRKADAVAGKDSKKAKTTAKTDKGKVPEAASDLPSSGGEASGIPNQSAANEEDTPVPAVLSFDFEQAKNHLITADSRFEDLFSKMPCRPFEHLEQVHPFR
jgi:DNA-3-methyladenine glycosylase II